MKFHWWLEWSNVASYQKVRLMVIYTTFISMLKFDTQLWILIITNLSCVSSISTSYTFFIFQLIDIYSSVRYDDQIEMLSVIWLMTYFWATTNFNATILMFMHRCKSKQWFVYAETLEQSIWKITKPKYNQ